MATCLFTFSFVLAMQMWTLARFLLFTIGYKIPQDNKHWNNFLTLLEIMNTVFSQAIPEHRCAYLEWLIEERHTNFKQLYPSTSITMKMHSMIHMPCLILKYAHMCIFTIV